MAGKGSSKYWSMTGTHNGVKFESGFEKKFLEICRQLGIKVVRSVSVVKYQDATGKWHRYYPDFYWPQFDYTVEIKGSWALRGNHGYVREKWKAADKHFKGRYAILTEKELKSGHVYSLYMVLISEKGSNNVTSNGYR